GTLNNQTMAPTLAADGYHQVMGSITIDHGSTSIGGTTDIDGQARAIGSAPDIGADELEHGTATSVSCAPGMLTLGAGSTNCAATIADTDGSPTAPTGSVAFTSSPPGIFASAGSCSLSPVSASTASCQLSYTPTQLAGGTHQITSSYPGGSAHGPSQGT